MTLKRLPARTAGLLMPLILSILMTFVVSAVVTLTNVGLTNDVLGKWMSAWGLSWVIAFPTLLCALPVARRAVKALVEPA